MHLVGFVRPRLARNRVLLYSRQAIQARPKSLRNVRDCRGASLSIQFLSQRKPNCLTRPEKSLHFLVRSPDSNLHFLVSPEIALHLITG
jgi:hypothetical protein